MQIADNHLLKCLFLCCYLAGCSSSDNQNSQHSSSEEANHSSEDIQMKLINIESIINSGEQINTIKVNQTIRINSEQEPKWRVTIGRKFKSSITLTKSKNKYPLNLIFNEPGDYSIVVESILSHSEKMVGQMPNIQKHQLTFHVQ